MSTTTNTDTKKLSINSNTRLSRNRADSKCRKSVTTKRVELQQLLPDYRIWDNIDVIGSITDQGSCAYEVTSNTDKSSKGSRITQVESETGQIIHPSWSFSFTEGLPICNLSKARRNEVLYASSHLLVSFDSDTNQQKIFRGHVNAISCFTCSGDRRWLASGDKGPDNVIIVWDGHTANKIRTIYDPHFGGVICLQFTQDAKFIASLSADLSTQELAIWNWTDGNSSPFVSINVNPATVIHTQITFKFTNYYMLTTSSESQVKFHEWSFLKKIESHTPFLEENFQKRNIKFSGTEILPGGTRAITTTNQGTAIIWEDVENDKDATILRHQHKKTVVLHDKAITFLAIARCYPSTYTILIGCYDGCVKFFDRDCKLLNCFTQFNYGPIRCISFADRGIWDTKSEDFDWRFHLRPQFVDYPHCSNLKHELFVIDDFCLSTSEGTLLSYEVKAKRIKLLNVDHAEDVTTISTHPNLPHLVTCSTTGLIKQFDYHKRICIARRSYGKENPISICRHNKTGSIIALGFSAGTVRLLDSLTLRELTEAAFTLAKGRVSLLDFDKRDEFCAYDDAAFTTTLLRCNREAGPGQWEYVARLRAHHRRITSLIFWTSRIDPAAQSHLFTIGEDRIISDYDIHNAKLHSLSVLRRIPIEVLPVPLSLAQPPVGCFTDDFLIMSTSDYKLKLLDPVTLIIRSTAGTFPEGIAMKKMMPLPQAPESTSSDKFLLTLSDERLSVVMGPFDGDPLKATNILAHPNFPRGDACSSDLAVSYDGQLAFTAGGPDKCVHAWTINPRVLEERVANAVDLRYRFYALMSPTLLEDMKDYCYYVMLRTQGVRTLLKRGTSLTIPLNEIPNIMRAVGYYPTEAEITNMINEVKHIDFEKTGEYKSDVDLDKLIQMYCNYRSCIGFQTNIVEKAINTLAGEDDEDSSQSFGSGGGDATFPSSAVIESKKLFAILREIGDKFSESELLDNLAILLGRIAEGGRPELTEPVDELVLLNAVHMAIPQKIDAETLIDTILNMDECIHKKYSTDKSLESGQVECSKNVQTE